MYEIIRKKNPDVPYIMITRPNYWYAYKNFDEVINVAENSKGFKTGKHCESVKIGFDYDAVLEIINSRVNNYSRIFILGQGGYTLEQQAYFDKLKKQTPKDVFVISLSGEIEKDNILNLNACYDSFAIVKLTEMIRDFCELPMTVFYPECDRYTVSQLIYLKDIKNIDLYVGRCTPIILNPSLMNSLYKVFDIKGITTVKKDLLEILNKNRLS